MATSRVLLVDGQLFQSQAFHRGIGKYSLALLEELGAVTKFYKHKKLLLNTAAISDEDLSVIKKVAKGFEIVRLDFHHIVRQDVTDYRAVTAHNKSVVDGYIAAEHADDDIDFVILSLFHEQECPAFPSSCRNKYLVTFDLIPLQFPKLYLHDQAVRDGYLCRFKVLFEADHFFPISRTVAIDLTAHLGVPPENITPIYGAQVRRKRITPQAVTHLENKQYILMPTGDDYRKNNRRAALGFELFNKAHGYAYELVITSFFGDHTRTELNSVAGHLYFSGNVSEAELSWLYQHAEVVLFPTEYEGLGMPALEAVEFGKPVVCSAIEVFKELSQTAFTLCDPYDVQSIAQALDTALGAQVDEQEYTKVLQRYSWGKTAQLMASAMEQTAPAVTPGRKPTLAVFAPKPNGFSAIGKVVQEQHYVASRLADIDYFIDEGLTPHAQAADLRASYLPYVANVYNPLTFDGQRKQHYDQAVYHIGNGEYHAVTLTRALSYPDTIVLHDATIEGLYNVTQSAGLISASRLEAERNLQTLVSPKTGSFLTSLVSKQRQVIVHSQYTAEAARAATIGSSPRVLPENLPTPALYYADDKPAQGTFTVALAGIIHQAKGIDLVHEIAGITLDSGEAIRVKIFGFSLVDAATEAGLTAHANVELIKAPSDTRFLTEMASCDVVVNFRQDYHGETSLSTLEALRLGKDVIVNNTGWFAELPDGIVWQIADRKAIAGTIKTIAGLSTAERSKLSKKRLAYIAKHHGIAHYTRTMIGTEQ